MKIVLNNIRSCWNVGSIIRTCDATNCQLVLVGYTPKPTGATLKKITKTSIGAEKFVDWEHFDNYQQVLAKYSLAKNLHLGLEITSHSQDIYDFLNSSEAKNFSTSFASQNVLVWFGNEIHGLAEEVLKNLNLTLHLHMKGRKESLNVASTVCATTYLLQQKF